MHSPGEFRDHTERSTIPRLTTTTYPRNDRNGHNLLRSVLEDQIIIVAIIWNMGSVASPEIGPNGWHTQRMAERGR
jgi:hypothetical protein